MAAYSSLIRGAAVVYSVDRVPERLQKAEEIGAAPYLAVPEANAAERQYERIAEIGSHRDVFAELVRRPRERVGG